MVGDINDATSTVDAKDVEGLQRVLADRLVTLAALYADLKSKQLTLGIMLICAGIGVICACMGCICLWERQAKAITEDPFEERTRRFKAALGGDSGSQDATGSENPFAERQRQLRRQVRILPADNDDGSSGDDNPQLAGRAGDAIASGPNGTATSPLRRRKRVSGSSAAEQPGSRKDPDAADTAAETMTAGRADAAVEARSNPVSPQTGGWLSWLPFRVSAGAPTDELVKRQMKGQYAERQAYLRQQIKILPADDSDD